MSFKNIFAIGCGKLAYRLMRLLGRQASTLPGKITLTISKDALTHVSKKRRIVCVTGTNGKTTTTSIVADILRAKGEPVTTNHSGANLQTGLMTSMMTGSHEGWTVLEVDEAALAACSDQLNPEIILVTNVFEDQIDRFGDMDHVVKLIEAGCSQTDAKLILCADDPNLAALGKRLDNHEVIYFGAHRSEGEPVVPIDAEEPGTTDDVNCPVCRQGLSYTAKTLGHLGFYECSACGFSRPDPDYVFQRSPRHNGLTIMASFKNESGSIVFPLDGLYNAYNACAALALADRMLSGYLLIDLLGEMTNARPQFGRLERFPWKDKEICFLLVKNATGLEQGVRLVLEKNDVGGILFFLNNNIADGKSTDWIWDANLEKHFLPDVPLGCGGDRGADMARRLEHWLGDSRSIVLGEDDERLVMEFLNDCPTGKCIYLLPNYTSMLSLRARLAERLGFNKHWE